MANQRPALRHQGRDRGLPLRDDWTLVCETCVRETDDPVNYRWVEGKLVPVNPNCESCGVELKSDPPQDDEFSCWCHQCNVKRRAQPPAQRELDF
jgi:hypothetical protein